MNCSEFQQALPDLVDMGLPLPDSKEVALHMKACPACRNEWDWAVGISTAFHALPDPLPSPRLSQPIFEELYGSSRSLLQKAKALWLRFPEFLSVVPRLAPAMIVLFIAVGAGLALLPGKESGQKVSVAEFLHPEERFTIPHQELLPPVNTLLREVATEPSSPMRQRLLKPEENLAPAPFSISEIEKVYRDRKEALMEQDADSLLMRGRRYKSMGRVDLALRDFETIYRFYPDYLYMGDVLMYRAQCLAFQGEFNKAIGSLETYLKKEPAKKGLIQPMIDQLKTHQTQAE